jgi:hypothetical protein
VGNDQPSLYRIIKPIKANPGFYGNALGGSFSGCSRHMDVGVKPTGRVKRRIHGVPEKESPNVERKKVLNYGVSG